MTETRKGFLLDQIPHSKALAMHVIEVIDGHALMRVPWREDLVGNAETGVLHGGVITSVLDNASGLAVTSAMGEWCPMATLDLRIDYMKPSTPGIDLLASAHCHKLTKSIAFVRGVAYHEDPDDPIATTVATFMISPNRPSDGQADKNFHETPNE
jgi:uncharacterized protein (TIGR00369 family)